MKRNNYKSTIRNQILNQTLIGLVTCIDQHSDPSLVGKTGKIYKESRNILVLEVTENKFISVPKSNGIFKFYIEDIEVSINGLQLVGNQKSRSKKKFRTW